MHHGVTDLDTSWKAIEHQPAYFPFKNRDQFRKLSKIPIGSMNCRGKVSLKISSDLLHFVALRVAHKQCRRSKDLRIKTRVLQERRGVDLKQYRAHGKTPAGQRLGSFGGDARYAP